MRSYLDFEKPVAEIEAKIDELRALETGDSAAAIGEDFSEARLGQNRERYWRDYLEELTAKNLSRAPAVH